MDNYEALAGCIWLVVGFIAYTQAERINSSEIRLMAYGVCFLFVILAGVCFMIAVKKGEKHE